MTRRRKACQTTAIRLEWKSCRQSLVQINMETYTVSSTSPHKVKTVLQWRDPRQLVYSSCIEFSLRSKVSIYSTTRQRTTHAFFMPAKQPCGHSAYWVHFEYCTLGINSVLLFLILIFCPKVHMFNLIKHMFSHVKRLKKNTIL